MKGTINLDSKSVISATGQVYTIAGVLLKKTNERTNQVTEVVYGPETRFCQVNIFPGLVFDIRILDSERAYLL